MGRRIMFRSLRIAALAAVITMGLASVAWAHGDDDYYYRHDETREHGYQNGFRDGVDHGRYDRTQKYRYNYKSDQWEDADRGYEHWMGSRGQYKRAYRDGYVRGYERGYNSYSWRNDGDRDDYRRHDRDDWR